MAPRLRPFLLASTLLVTLLAGCAQQQADVLGALDEPAKQTPTWTPLTVDPWPAVQAKMAGVPCQAEASAGASSPNLSLLSKLDLPSDKDGIHAELDVRGGLGVHARYQASGFELYDLRDPLNPVLLGNWTSDEHSGALDVKFSPDNATVLLGANDGIHFVDVRDPLHPKSVGYWDASEIPESTSLTSLGYNTHMLFTKRIDGQDYVFIAPNANTGIWILRMEGTPDARTLTFLSQTAPVEGGPLGPHDLYVQKDGLDGHWYLYSADGFHGWTAFNIDDPAQPLPAGGFVNPAEGAYTHSIQAATVGGKRIVATSAEIGLNLLRVYDATVLAAPILMGVWSSETQSSTDPQHNMNIANGTLFLSYYSHGLYAFDLRTIAAGPTIPLIGAATITPSAHWAVEGEGGGYSGYWDTVVENGVVHVSHIEGGLLSIGYGCTPYPDPSATSDG